MRKHRGRIRLGFCLLAGLMIAWVGGWSLVHGQESTPKLEDVPDVVILDELEDLYTPVPFEHRLHAEMAEMGKGCEVCHHHTPNGNAHSSDIVSNGLTAHTQDEAADIPACKSCHSITEEDGNIRMPSLNAAYHRQCLDCHREWDQEKSCSICHQPKTTGEAPATEMPTPAEVLGRMHPPAETPKDVVYESRYVPDAGKYVTFRHDEHVKTFGFKCAECHRNDSCSTCHSENGDINSHKPLKPSDSWRMSHEPCLACHDHQSCDHCHHKEKDNPPPLFEHRMTGQLLDENHNELLCRECHGSVQFTATPTCGDASCHKSPEVAAYPDKRPGEQIATAFPGVRRQTLSSVIGVAPRVGRAEETGISQSIIHAPTPMPDAPDRVKMKTIDRPTTISESCVTSECHVAIKSYDVVHGPVAIDACGICHELTDEEKHEFKVAREGAALCTYCHEFDVDAMPVVHEPTRNGECLGCHNPHGGRDQSITRDGSIELLCNRCHESVTMQQAFLHTPVNDGYCVSCHSPHASRYPKLLDAYGPDLCIMCHDEFGQQLGQVKFVHKAMDERCIRCHDAHGSMFPLSLTAPVPALCLDCHESLNDQLVSEAFAHSPTTEGSSCMTCHTPHGGDLASLMRDLPARICVQCHNEAIVTEDDRIIGAMNEVLSADLFKHGQINEGECSGCHNPHGGERQLLLTGSFPVGLYAPFDLDSFELCFQCHEKALATDANVSIGEDSPTQFRNGELNLHYLHVSSGVGRSCNICHETHTGENEKLVRTAVPYQKWEAPLDLTLTDTGGRCVTGCHLPFSYDRVSPVAYVKQREAGEAMRRIRLSAASKLEVRWHATDSLGDEVAVPDAERLTLLLFMRADPGDDIDTVEAVRKAIPRRQNLQVVLIVSGEKAVERADAIHEACDPSWHVVQEEQSMVNISQIKARPIVQIIQSDGKEMARIDGAPQSLAMKLEAYIDLANQDEAMASVIQPLEPGVVGQHTDIDSDQYLRVARQLIEEGKPKRAEQALSEAMELYPQRGAFHEELIGLLITTDRAGEAIDMLDRVPSDIVNEQTASILRARASIKLQRWQEAKTIVEQLLANDPDLREAHHLMGLIQQHEGNWREASESFLRALGTER